MKRMLNFGQLFNQLLLVTKGHFGQTFTKSSIIQLGAKIRAL